MSQYKVYVAGPVFSFAERMFNNTLVKLLSELLTDAEFLLPQNYSASIVEQEDFLEKVFNYCVSSVDEADALLCILDGPDVDSGTSIELGYAYARNKPILGIRTDFRSSEDRGVNLMVSGVCNQLLWLSSINTTIGQMSKEIAKALSRILRSRPQGIS